MPASSLLINSKKKRQNVHIFIVVPGALSEKTLAFSDISLGITETSVIKEKKLKLHVDLDQVLKTCCVRFREATL